MKPLVIAGTLVTLASAVSYAALFATSMSEAAVLLIWGGSLLVLARGVRLRPSVAHRPVIVARPSPDVRSTGAIRLQPGL